VKIAEYDAMTGIDRARAIANVCNNCTESAIDREIYR
jgi:hypothetical protein